MSKRPISDPEDILDVSDTNSTGGTPAKVSRYDLAHASVQANVASGSYLLEASNDGLTWFDVGGGAITADSMLLLTAQYNYLRVFTTTDGEADFTLAAHEEIY